MDLNGVLDLAPKLAAAVLAEDDYAARILAADLKAAHEAEQTFSPWTPWNPREAS